MEGVGNKETGKKGWFLAPNPTLLNALGFGELTVGKKCNDLKYGNIRVGMKSIYQCLYLKSWNKMLFVMLQWDE